MTPLEQCVAALREIRDEGVTSLRAVYLIDEALIAAEAAIPEQALRDRVVTRAVDLVKVGYDGPFMGDDVEPLISAVLRTREYAEPWKP